MWRRGRCWGEQQCCVWAGACTAQRSSEGNRAWRVFGGVWVLWVGRVDAEHSRTSQPASRKLEHDEFRAKNWTRPETTANTNRAHAQVTLSLLLQQVHDVTTETAVSSRRQVPAESGSRKERRWRCKGGRRHVSVAEWLLVVQHLWCQGHYCYVTHASRD